MRALVLLIALAAGTACAGNGSDDAPSPTATANTAATATPSAASPPAPTDAASPTSEPTAAPAATPTAEQSATPTPTVVPPTPTAVAATPTVPAATPTVAPPASATIQLSGYVIYRFVPEHVSIAAGGAVTWQWVAGVHNVVGDGPINHPDVVSDPGYTYTARFPSPGTYAFTCDVHPDDMDGTVTVR